MFTFFFGHCYLIPSLHNGSSVSVTARSIALTHFLQSRVGWPMIVPECQRDPANDVLIAMTSFLETRRNRVNKECGR
jgi:hypothetical protein